MARVLVTGMSGAGKSTVLEELGRRGIRVVDTDYGGWSLDVPDDAGSGVTHVWDEARIGELLDGPVSEPLVVSGTVSNQGRFYDRFSAVVLLSAPADVLLERLRTRTGNPFGKDLAELRRILRDINEVLPLLQASSSLEIDATRSVEEIADEVEALARRS
jgi:dephospho-CoA kinase